MSANDTLITVIGNLTGDPELRWTPGGSAVANFSVASTPRTFDRTTNDWKDGETLFLRCSVWREMAENVANSLVKGTRVLVTGKLVSRSYVTKEGDKRTVMELAVEEIGPSLRWANAKVARTQQNGTGNGQGGGSAPNAPAAAGPDRRPSQGAQRPAQPRQQEDPWATPQGNQGGQWGNGPDAEPPF